MRCPLDQSVLRTHEGSEAQILFGETCHGIWLDREQLSMFVRNPIAAKALPRVKVVSGKASGSAGTRLCPSCGPTILKAKVVDGVEIDLCPACHGIWLDAGELDSIVARYRRKQALTNVADQGSDIFADFVTDPSLLSDLTDTIAETLGKGSEWAADAGPALLEFIGDALSSLDF